jgi:cell wall-associated NlpC family hydrolase
MTLPDLVDTARPAAPRRRRIALLAAGPLFGALAAGLIAAPAASANTPLPHDPLGSVKLTANADGSLQATGWAFDPDVPTANATVYGLVDGRRVSSVVTSLANKSVTTGRHAGPTPGFSFAIAMPDTAPHVACVAVHNVAGGIGRILGCHVSPHAPALSSTQTAAHSPRGALSVARSASTLNVSGWALEPDFLSSKVLMVLYVDGQSTRTFATHTADAAQRAAGSGKYGAFSTGVPVSRAAHLVCMWAVNAGVGSNTLLGCKAVDTRGWHGSGPVPTPTVNTTALREANRHLGQPYVWGAEGPKQFDCSGLVIYSYHKAGLATPRIAADQFAAARLIPASRAVPGDLVFYHDATGYVFHVGIYISPGMTIAAVDPQEGVTHQSIDAGSATYGSFTHT